MKKKIHPPLSDAGCFFCRKKEGAGLNLSFFWDGKKKEASTEYLPLPHGRGKENRLHEVVQTGLLNEIMAWTAHVYTQKTAVPSDLNLNFLQPAAHDEKKIKLTCQVLSRGGPEVTLQATLSNHADAVCTTARGVYHILPSGRHPSLVREGQDKKKEPASTRSIKPDLEWVAGPDRDMSWYEAREWVRGLNENEDGWQMPSIEELKELYNQTGPAPLNIHSTLKTTGWWLWSREEEGPLSAWGVDIILGRAISGGRSLVSGGRVFAVRTPG